MPTNDKQPSRDGKGDIGEAIQLVKAYAKQETVDPLKAVGGYLKFAIPGIVLLALGWIFLLVGLLRLLQKEVDWLDGGWSFAPYLIVVAAGAIVILLVMLRVRKGDLRG